MAEFKNTLMKAHGELLQHKEELSKMYGGYSLALAMCMIESSGEKYSFNYEPDFRKVYIDPLKINSEAQFEIVFRATSFGLFQILGQVIREQNIKSKIWPLRDVQSEEFMADVGIQVNCYIKHMTKFYNRYYSPVRNNDNLIWDMVSSYNQGNTRKTMLGKYKNQEYVDKVRNTRKQIEENYQSLLS